MVTDLCTVLISEAIGPRNTKAMKKYNVIICLELAPEDLLPNVGAKWTRRKMILTVKIDICGIYHLNLKS